MEVALLLRDVTTEYLIMTVIDPQMPAQNKCHIRMRYVVGQSYGVWKRRFQFLRGVCESRQEVQQKLLWQ